MNRVERTALVSVVINIGLVFLKVTLATLSGSIALIADAWHSGSDVVASALVWTGARISHREGRVNLAVAENIVGIIISGLILWAAVSIFQKVSAVASAPIRNLPLAIGGSLVAALVSYYAAQYKMHVGRETGSISLIADGYHSRMDTLTTGAVVVGLMGHGIGIQLDRIAAVVVALFVVESAVAIGSAAIRGLREGKTAQAESLADVLQTRPALALGKILNASGVWTLFARVRSTVRRPEWRRRCTGILVVLVLVVWAGSSVSFIGPGRVGVVMRWGKALDEILTPGVHMKAPWPIDRVTRIELQQVRRLEIGFRTRKVARSINAVAAEFYATLWESRHAAGTYEKLPEEALRLTGDENIVDINVVFFYRVSDPKTYLFRVAEMEDFVRFMAESVMTNIAGRLAIDDVVTVERDVFEELIRTLTQELLDAADAGVEVVGVRLQDVHPPLEVVPAFRDVASAREDKSRIMNEALGYMEQTIPVARGDARRLVLEAEGYRSDRIDRAHGDSDRFKEMARHYRNSRGVTETRLYLETMESLLAGMEKYIVSADIDLEGYDIRVFDKELSSDAAIQD
ncbi:MAG: FtsH protease activity modulator HflK [Candidatus Eisenbacteria bacterium]|nr:FtsH protease activity modulator HflK [Candidatus Eisenbacteria bacterium]